MFRDASGSESQSRHASSDAGRIHACYNLTFAEQIGCLPYANWVNGRISSDIPCSATA